MSGEEKELIIITFHIKRYTPYLETCVPTVLPYYQTSKQD